MPMFLSLFLATVLAATPTHDITSLSKWGPYSKEYFGISHIADLSSGIQVEFCLVPGVYRRNVKVPCALFESDVHPWAVSADMKHITYRQEIEWKDLAEKLGLNYTGVNRWFKVDDISISYIFKIAELYDLKVKTTIKPKSSIS